MTEVKKEGILVKKTLLDFESEGVLNPAIIADNNCIHLLYRAVAKHNHSSIGYCEMSAPLVIRERSEKALIAPEFDYESQGVEDPRVVKIDDLFYLTYTAYNGVNALGALALSKDLVRFEKKGIIVPHITYKEFDRLTKHDCEVNEKYLRYNEPWKRLDIHVDETFLWDKNVVFFPRKINGMLHFLHRIRPDIQIVAINNLEDLTPQFWENYFLHFSKHIVLSSKYAHEVSYIGAGCPPIETEHGWLLIYHGVHDTIAGYVYSACAALLDLQNPCKELARLPYALFAPEHEWEKEGEVNNVCFPTGALVVGDTLYIYYGAADEQIACASLSLASLLKELIQNIKK